jgi:hypothetical protein
MVRAGKGVRRRHKLQCQPLYAEAVALASERVQYDGWGAGGMAGC